jgi:gluconokinase
MPKTDQRILALDLGTSSARALVLTADASPVPGALARHKITPTYGAAGEATLGLHDYVEGLLGCLDELQQNGHLTGISDIVLSSQWHSIVALDGSGEPLTPVIPWVDTRTVPPSLDSSFDEHAFHARTGAWLHRLYWTRRIPWLATIVPAASYAGLPDLVLERLTGERVTSVSIASGTGTLDLASGRYDDEALAVAGVTEKHLPPIVPTGWTGSLSPEYARRWPGLVDVPAHPPTGDGAASNVGTGGYDESTAAVTVGTSAAVRVVHPIEGAPELPWELWRYRVDDKRAVTGMAFSAAGNLHAWLTDVLRLEGEHREPVGVEVGSSRVIAIPFQAGTRRRCRVVRASTSGCRSRTPPRTCWPPRCRVPRWRSTAGCGCSTRSSVVNSRSCSAVAVSTPPRGGAAASRRPSHARRQPAPSPRSEPVAPPLSPWVSPPHPVERPSRRTRTTWIASPSCGRVTNPSAPSQYRRPTS